MVTIVDHNRPALKSDGSNKQQNNSQGTIDAINAMYAAAQENKANSGNNGSNNGNSGSNVGGNTGNKGNTSSGNVSSSNANSSVGNSSSGGSNGSLSGFLSNFFNKYNQNNNQDNNQTGTSTFTPDTTVEDSYKASMDAANDRLKQAYEYQQTQLSKAKDDALREAWIKQQMVERGYPEQLAAAGINGGAAQGLLARNNADYANQRSNIQGNYLNNLGEAGQTYQQGILQNNADYLANMAAYRQQLDALRREWELEQLTNSGTLKNINQNSNNILGLSSKKLTPQEYLNNLRNQTGNLFK